jgi:hypothetical protein
MSREKMLEHLAAAEKAQAEVDKLEKRAGWALEGDREYERKLFRASNQEEKEALRLYHISKVLEGNKIYQRAVGNRNSHREWVKVYALAILANEAEVWTSPSI